MSDNQCERCGGFHDWHTESCRYIDSGAHSRTIPMPDDARDPWGDEAMRRALAVIARLKRTSMPHMCRTDHEEIRHATNRADGDPRCPMCKMRDDYEAEIQRLREALEAVGKRV